DSPVPFGAVCLLNQAVQKKLRGGPMVSGTMRAPNRAALAGAVENRRGRANGEAQLYQSQERSTERRDMSQRLRLGAFVVFGLVLAFAGAVSAQEIGRRSRPMVTTHIDETRLVSLEGNTRPEANLLNDRGRVSDDFMLEHMLLQL